MKSDEKGSAVQYATALLQLTEASGEAEEVFKNLASVCKAFEEDPEITVLFKHPAISAPQKKKFLDEFGNGMDKLSLRLLHILCERRKMNLLPLIVAEFKQLLLAKHNIMQGTLYTAETIDDGAVDKIKERLRNKLGKRVDLTVQVDKSLIGGYVLRIGDQVIDGSLKGRLQSIEKALLSV